MLPGTLRLEHDRDHCVRNDLSTHHPTNGLPCHAPLITDEESVLRIIHREVAVATHLLVSLLEAPQLRVETAMA